jgi:chromate reductase
VIKFRQKISAATPGPGNTARSAATYPPPPNTANFLEVLVMLAEAATGCPQTNNLTSYACVMAVRFLCISGSTRGSSTNTAALRTAHLVAPNDVTTVLFEGLAILPAFTPDEDPQHPHPAVRELREQIAAADAVVFTTPEYAGALPGSLKNLIDWIVGSGELYRKPVAWINVAAEGRGEAAYAELARVLGYVDARVIEQCCRRLPVLPAAVGTDGDIVDAEFRDRLADVLATLAHQVGK